MSQVRETTLTFFIMYLSPLTSEVYLLVNLFRKPVHNGLRHFTFYTSPQDSGEVLWFHVGCPCACLSINMTICIFASAQSDQSLSWLHVPSTAIRLYKER